MLTAWTDVIVGKSGERSAVQIPLVAYAATTESNKWTTAGHNQGEPHVGFEGTGATLARRHRSRGAGWPRVRYHF